MHYLIYGYYGYGNFGDDLLLQALVEGIRGRDVRARFTVYCLAPVAGYEDDPGIAFAPLARFLQNARARPWRLARYIAGFSGAIARTDVLVIGGGALFIDKGRFSASLALLYGAALLARLRRRRVVIVGVGIDDLRHPASRWLTHRIFALAEFAALREKPIGFVLPRRVDRRTELAADLVYGLPLEAPPPRVPAPKRAIGLCLIDYYRTVEPDPKRHASYEAAVLRFIEHRRAANDFIAITLQRGTGLRDDWLPAMLQSHNAGIPAIHVDGIAAARAAVARIDVLVTMRLHLGILGAIWGKPVVVIDHERKMAALAEALALPRIALHSFVSQTEPDLDVLLAGYDPERTRQRVVRERAMAPLNFAWLDA